MQCDSDNDPLTELGATRQVESFSLGDGGHVIGLGRKAV